METKKFLQTVLGDEGYYCIWSKNYDTDEQSQVFYDDLDDAIDAAFDKDNRGWNAFFALSTFETNRTRAAANAKWIKSFFVDLDCGPNKDFPSQSDAIKALKKFCTDNSLPSPTKVNSGNGVHVYWPLKEKVCREDWQPVADRLKKLCAEQNFPADPSRTADAASILRVPNTHNYKNNGKKPVALLGVEVPKPVDFEDFAMAVGGGMIPVPQVYVPRGPDPVLDALSGSTQSTFNAIVKKTISGKGCAQIAHIIKNQDTMSEPLWRAGLSIAINCSDGDTYIHKISSGHPDYSKEDTVRKAERLIDMPYTCAKFDEFNPDVCSACPLFGKIGSPITLGKEYIEATEEDREFEEPIQTHYGLAPKSYVPEYPAPYFRGRAGGVFMRGKKDEDGTYEEIVVYHNDFYVTRRLKDPELGEVISFALHLPKDGLREFVVPLSSVTSREEFRKNMAVNGIVLIGAEDVNKMMQYTQKWIHKLQAETNAVNAHVQFGWTNKNMEEFVLGSRVVGATDNEYNPPSSKLAGLVDAFEPAGTRDRQLDMLEFYNRPNFELHQFIVGSGYGSPLMRMTGMGSLAVHMWGGSGVGKTTAMHLAIGLAGSPEELMLKEDDTHNSRMNRGERMKDLSLCSDEMTNMQKKGKQHQADASDYLYQISSGRQKNRMSANGNTERFRGDPWSLIALSTGNTSMWDMLVRNKAQPKAEMQRLLEVRVDKMVTDRSLKGTTDELFKDSKENYGWLMEEYIRYIINNREAVQSTLKKVQAKIDKAANLEAENRFWSAGCAAILTGLIYAKKIGHVNYDMEAVYKWTAKLLKERKAFVDDIGASVEDTIVDYITEHYNSFLRIKSTADKRKDGGTEDDPLQDTLVVPDRDARVALVGRYETDTHRVYLLKKPLRNWMVDQQLNYTETVRIAMESMEGKYIKARISKGTSLNLPSTDVIMLQLSKGIDE